MQVVHTEFPEPRPGANARMEAFWMFGSRHFWSVREPKRSRFQRSQSPGIEQDRTEFALPLAVVSSNSGYSESPQTFHKEIDLKVERLLQANDVRATGLDDLQRGLLSIRP